MISGISQSSQMASQLFSRLDTKSQGYLEKSDLTAAFSQIASQASSGTSSSSSSTSVDDVFAALDGDSNGQVTESEFSSVLSKLQEQLDSQFSQMRMNGHGGSGGPQGMAPPPPPSNDTGFTKDELSSQLDEIGSSDSQRSSLISNIVQNFDAADTDSDGKVSFTEAMAYDQSSQESSTSSSTSSSSTTASSTSSTQAASTTDAQLMMKIMQLMHAYGGDQSSPSGVSSLLSAVA